MPYKTKKFFNPVINNQYVFGSITGSGWFSFTKA